MRDPRDPAARDRRARPDGRVAGLAARERAAVPRVVGWDPDASARAAALSAAASTRRPAISPPRCAGADVIALCAPVSELPAVLAELAELAPEATVTDIGSTKSGVVAAVPARCAARFIGGHPICGMETRGAAERPRRAVRGRDLVPDAARRDGARPPARPAPPARGARRTPVAIDAGVHDRLLAVTSHLPHVLANLLVVQAGEARIDGHDPLTAIGGSFRDMTRVAARTRASGSTSSSTTARRCAGALREHQRALGEVLGALEAGDAGYLARWIGQAPATAGARWRRSSTSSRRSSTACRCTCPTGRACSRGSRRRSAPRASTSRISSSHHFTPERGGTIELLVAGHDAAERAVELLDAQGYGALAAPVLAEHAMSAATDADRLESRPPRRSWARSRCPATSRSRTARS